MTNEDEYDRPTTAKARIRAQRAFETQVDPDGSLRAAERAQRAAYLSFVSYLKAAKMAAKSAATRRRKAPKP